MRSTKDGGCAIILRPQKRIGGMRVTMMNFLIPSAMAADASASSGGPMPIDLLIIVAFALVLFHRLAAPVEACKEHRELVAGLNKGDEIIANGGLVRKLHRSKSSLSYLKQLMA